MLSVLAISLAFGQALAYDRTLAFNSAPQVENRTIDEIYAAAVAEGGVVTCWHGGDEKHQMDGIKNAFEKAFPKMTMNLTVDVSKYHDTRLDQQLATNSVYVDSVILQTLHDFPRWAREDALMNYAPLGFDKVFPAFKDSISASWYAVELLFWSSVWNTKKLPNMNLTTYESFLQPELKDKIVLPYPNDDDAVLFQFDQIMQQHGEEWFNKLLTQNPRWVRGTATPMTLLAQSNQTVAATFATAILFNQIPDVTSAQPTDGQFVSWGQTGAILKDAPHPEGAKLLHSFLLSADYQKASGWGVRYDVPPPAGVPKIMEMNNTNPTRFAKWMEDRAYVERLRFYFEDRIGTAQGLSPLIDGI